MACPQCVVNARSHSFVKFGNKDETSYWYTGAGKADELVDTPEKFTYFKQHLDLAKETPKWIWVFDCSGMTSRHHSSVDFMKRLVGSLSNEHEDRLQAIWIVNPSLWIRTAVFILSPFMNQKLTKKIEFIEGTGANFFVKLIGVRLYSAPWGKP
jgi:hypothetical protein